MFNRWKPYPQNKPKKRGWYICSIRYGEEKDQAYVMDLFWDEVREIWKDNRRANVFQTYRVMGWRTDLLDRPCETQIWHDNLCERNDVIAFKKLPKIYGYKSEKQIEHICNDANNEELNDILEEIDYLVTK